ncbi:DUF4175 domain-containing protein [Neogemmobacter tilapiae]|uniref:ATPase n=1 Tax=Neogemmobacter tilapiae TaxID=875041 RepID=A0A918WHQ7_9RHOB|nr:DUF4175 domain-containing protein [Gemmobacter tilapiae]GHC52661.1 ATPase [Gemmobacter tilapiae]
MREKSPDPMLPDIRWPLRLTWVGLWAERFARAFWPLWSILFTALAPLAFGLQDQMPLEVFWSGVVLAMLGSLWALWRGWRMFRKPARSDALARLDSALPGRPLAALTDDQIIGRNDAASVAVWQAHRARMARVAAGAKPVQPDLNLASRDPFGLRYMALTLLAVALIFGSLWRAANVPPLGIGPAVAGMAGPAWEGWASPPGYTGKPSLYLNDIPAGDVELPVGTKVQVRLYGEPGDLTLTETVSAALNPPPASEAAQEFEVRQSGVIRIAGDNGREWQVSAQPDGMPSVQQAGEITRERNGQMRLPFKAQDDYGVTSGTATIAPDMAAMDRRFGLAIEPEAREPLVIDLPMPISGKRTDFEEALMDDFSTHPFANLPVTVSLSVTDAAGQIGQSEPFSAVLTGKRFFDPLAAALVEMRRDLLWNRANGPRAMQILRAVTYKPETLIRNDKAALRLRVFLRKLDAVKSDMTPEKRDELAAELWEIALMVEEGDLQSALERLQRAQDRLDEAIKRGADQSEIDELMRELDQAMKEYMQELANKPRDPSEMQQSPGQQGNTVTQDQIQQMMEELKKALEEGRTADAAEIMEALRDLMENLQFTEGQGQGGPQGPGGEAMRDLQDTLRDQQDLSDDSFRELQQGPQGEEGNQGQEDQQGQNGERPGQPQSGQDGEGEGRDDRSLAERQQELRDRMSGLRDDVLPGQGTEEGDAARRQLEEAGRAMDDAEEALRRGDLSGALDRQAEAMESLRDGLRQLGNAMAQNDPVENGEGEPQGRADPNSALDPLGRERDEGARIGSDRNMVQGDDIYRRAQELLDEIRRRSGEQARPDQERDYLKRLLDLF